MHTTEQYITNYQKEKCIKILDKISNYHISIMFSNPVDPIRDACPNYLQVIKHPMDLGTVRKNIENGIYTNVEQFKKDVNLIWENAYRYNGKESIMGDMAKQLQNAFKEMSEFLNSNDLIGWTLELNHLQTEINKIANRKSESIHQIEFSPPRKTISRQPTETPTLPLSRSATRSNFTEKDDSSTIISIKRSTSKKIQLSDEIARIVNASIEVEEEPEPDLPRYSDEEIQRLVDEINSIYDVNILHTIIDMIKQNNPAAEFEENAFDELEVQTSDIKQSTLIQIREYLDSLYEKEEENPD